MRQAGGSPPQPAGSGGEGELDELDALLARYEQQAAADAAAVQQRAPPAAKRPRLTANGKRDEALAQPLGADNKGFKLLAAMGYREGQALGKSGAGLSEPLPLLLKQDKLGLGAQSKKAAAREAAREREREAAQCAAAAAAAAEANRAGQRADYQQRAAAAAALRRVEGQLRKAQQVCETLDASAGVAWSAMWGQPPAEAAEHHAAAAAVAAAAGGGHTDELHEQLEPCHRAEAGAAIRANREEAAAFARLYARQAAGTAAGAAAALEQRQGGCPGGGGGGEPEGRLAEWERWQALPAGQRLAAVLDHLRQRHCYCLHCGARYDGEADLAAHCPGPSEDDH